MNEKDFKVVERWNRKRSAMEVRNDHDKTLLFARYFGNVLYSPFLAEAAAQLKYRCTLTW